MSRQHRAEETACLNAVILITSAGDLFQVRFGDLAVILMFSLCFFAIFSS